LLCDSGPPTRPSQKKYKDPNAHAKPLLRIQNVLGVSCSFQAGPQLPVSGRRPQDWEEAEII
jgi:hypothetical protein